MSTLVGRDAEIADAFSDARSVDAGSLLLAGPAGVGKTELSRHLAATQAAAGVVVHTVYASRATRPVPFGAFGELIDRLGLDWNRPIDVLSRFAGMLRGAAAGEATTADPPILIVVDDAHMLDELSAGLVLRLAVDRIRLLLTLRTGERVPDPITDVWKDGHARRVELEPLDEAGTLQLAVQLLGGPVEPATGQRVWQLTEGLPLYVRELLLAGVADGWLHRDEAGQWVADSGPPPFGNRLTELIRSRVDATAPEQRLVLDALSLAEPLTLHAATTLAPMAAVLALEERQLIRYVDIDGAVALRIDHPLVSEAVRQLLSPTRQRPICDRLVDLLRADDGPPLAHVRVAMLAMSATAPDPDLLIAGSQHAAAMFDFDAAVDLARAAAGAGGGTAAALALGDALSSVGRFADAQPVLEQALAGCADEALRLRIVTSLATVAIWGRGDHDAASDLLDSVSPTLSLPGRVELDAYVAGLRTVQGRPVEGLALAEAVLDQDPLPPIARLRACTVEAWALAMLDRSDDVHRVVDEHLGFAFEHGDEFPFAIGELLACQLLGHWMGGDLATMERTATDLRDLADPDDHPQRAVWSHFLGIALVARGRPESAIRALQVSIDTFSDADPTRLRGWSTAVSAQAHAQLGRVDAARSLLEASRSPAYAGFRSYDYDRFAADALIAAARHDVDGAVASAMRGATEMRDVGRAAGESILLHLAARFGAAERVADRLAALARASQGALVPAMAAHADALAHDDADRLTAVSERFVRIGDGIAATEAAADAAVLLRRGGRTTDALAMAERANALAATCEGASTPTLRRLGEPASTALLTEREREIATLAAQGMSNADIADSLVVSVRTVGNHLYNVYAKLGIDGRRDLTQILGGQRPVT